MCLKAAEQQKTEMNLVDRGNMTMSDEPNHNSQAPQKQCAKKCSNCPLLRHS